MSDTLNSEAINPWRRLAATAIDLILLLPASSLLQQLLTREQALAAMISLAIIAMLFSWRLFGATPGMALMDCTLINHNGHRPRLHQLGMRLLGIVLAALPFGLGLLMILKGPQHQGWQDRFSGTLIITDDEGRKSLAQLEEEAQ